MNTLKKYNRKYQGLVGIIVALIWGIILGICQERTLGFWYLGFGRYKNMDAPVSGGWWVAIIFAFAIFHLSVYKFLEEYYDTDLITFERKKNYKEILIFGSIGAIEINLLYWPYVFGLLGNIFTVVPMPMILLTFIGLSLSAVIAFTMMYLLAIGFRKGHLFFIVSYIWFILFYNNGDYFRDAPAHYIRMMQTFNPITQGYEYQRVITYYGYMDEFKHQLDEVYPLTNYGVLLAGAIILFMVLTELIYYLKCKNIYADFIDCKED